MPSVRKAALLVPLAAVVLLAGCASIANPEGWAPPNIVDGTLYVTLSDGEITAFDPDTFDPLWEFPVGDEFACGDEGEEQRELDGIYGAPAIGDDLVYVGAYDGNVYAVNKGEGTCEWLFETDDPIVGGLVLDGDRLYVPSTDGNLYVLDPDTGEEIDSYPAGDIWSTPLLTEDGQLYVTTMEGRLWRFDTGAESLTGEIIFDVDTGLLTNPVLADGTIVAGGIGETLFGIDADTGEERWAVIGGNWFWGEPAVGDGTVFATNLDGSVYAVDVASGDEVWSFDTEAPIRAGAALAEDLVVVVNNDGDVYGLNLGTGDIVWGPSELNTTVHATPVTREETALVSTRGGSIYSIALETGRPTEVVD